MEKKRLNEDDLTKIMEKLSKDPIELEELREWFIENNLRHVDYLKAMITATRMLIEKDKKENDKEKKREDGKGRE